MRQRHCPRGIALSVAAVATLVASTVAAQPDTWVTSKAQIAVLTAEDVRGVGINIDTSGGKVTLQGEVPTQADRIAAERVVRSVEGVNNVDNLLAVVPQEKSPLVRTDEEIKEAVHNELAIDHGLTGANIRVVSVEKGIVTLAGTVPSMSTHVRALQTVMRVPGVVGVKSQIEAPDVLGDADTAARVSYR